MTHVTTFSHVGYKQEPAGLLLAQDVGVPGVGNAAKNSAGNTLILKLAKRRVMLVKVMMRNVVKRT
jgi:hypothetical protein